MEFAEQFGISCAFRMFEMVGFTLKLSGFGMISVRHKRSILRKPSAFGLLARECRRGFSLCEVEHEQRLITGHYKQAIAIFRKNL